MDERDILEGDHRISVFGDAGQFTFEWVDKQRSTIEFLPDESVNETVSEPVQTLLSENGYVLHRDETPQSAAASTTDQWPVEIQVSYNITDRMQLDRIVASELPSDALDVKKMVKSLSQVTVTYHIDSKGNAEMVAAEDVTVEDRLDATTQDDEEKENTGNSQQDS